MYPDKRQIKDNQINLSDTAVVSALVQYRDGFYRFAKHIHKTFEIYLITRGCCNMDINSETVSCEQGDYILILPNTVHSFYLNSDAPCTFQHIHFDASKLTGLSIKYSDNNFVDIIYTTIFSCNFFYKTKADRRIAGLIQSIITDTEQNTVYSSTYANLHIAELLLYTTELISARATNRHEKLVAQNTYVSYTIDYIRDNYASKILISDIAKHLNISGRYLSKLFYQYMNLTILNYINIYRINQAIDLMMNTEEPLTVIATQIGLKDSQHFSKLFRNIIGITPYRYRQLLKHEFT